MKYKVHRFDLKMDTDKDRLEEFLNRLEGEIVSIVPNVNPTFQRVLKNKFKIDLRGNL